MIEFTARVTRRYGFYEEEIKFFLTPIYDGTTTVLYGQMEERNFGKTSVAGCAILSPMDTYNEITGLKVAFKNLVSSQFRGDIMKQIYSQFRHMLFTTPLRLMEC